MNVLSGFNSLIPKRDIIIFNSFPDLSGNSLALYEYILNERHDILQKYTLVWTVGEITAHKGFQILKNRTGLDTHIVLEKRSLKGIFKYFSAKYVISTHGYFPSIGTAGNQTHINLWHGMPFKRIGRMLESVHSNGKSDRADITIATSKVFQRLMAQSFGISPENVYVTGQPCNDMLAHRHNLLDVYGIDRGKYRKIIMWMPTYRKSLVGDIRSDGNENAFGVMNVLTEHFQQFNDCLKRKELMLLIKPHPMDTICKEKLPESQNIKVLLNEQITGNNHQLYEVLSDCDVLLTDYSSVFIDFFATGKPVAFICDDLDEYESTRGFCFDNPRDYMPGELISGLTQFIQYLDDMDNVNEKWRADYKKAQLELNPFCDGRSGERLCTALWGSKAKQSLK